MASDGESNLLVCHWSGPSLEEIQRRNREAQRRNRRNGQRQSGRINEAPIYLVLALCDPGGRHSYLILSRTLVDFNKSAPQEIAERKEILDDSSRNMFLPRDGRPPTYAKVLLPSVEVDVVRGSGVTSNTVPTPSEPTPLKELRRLLKGRCTPMPLHEFAPQVLAQLGKVSCLSFLQRHSPEFAMKSEPGDLHTLGHRLPLRRVRKKVFEKGTEGNALTCTLCEVPSEVLGEVWLYSNRLGLARVSQCSKELHRRLTTESRFLVHFVARMVGGVDRLLQAVSKALRFPVTLDQQAQGAIRLAELRCCRPLTSEGEPADISKRTKVYLRAVAWDSGLGWDQSIRQAARQLMDENALTDLDYVIDMKSTSPFARGPLSEGLHSPLPCFVRISQAPQT